MSKTDNTLVYDLKTGIPFDFAIENMMFGKMVEGQFSHWTHLCPACSDKYQMVATELDEIKDCLEKDTLSDRYMAHCGVVACPNEAKWFFDFNGDSDPFVAAVRRVDCE